MELFAHPRKQMPRQQVDGRSAERSGFILDHASDCPIRQTDQEIVRVVHRVETAPARREQVLEHRPQAAIQSLDGFREVAEDPANGALLHGREHE
jgi:hypothetical protein